MHVVTEIFRKSLLTNVIDNIVPCHGIKERQEFLGSLLNIMKGVLLSLYSTFALTSPNYIDMTDRTLKTVAHDALINSNISYFASKDNQ